MGRPKGSKNKLPRSHRVELVPPAVVDNRSDFEIVEEIRGRFDIYHKMILGATSDSVTSLIVSGSAGVGKSYTAEWALEHVQRELEKRDEGTSLRVKIVRGTISALDLYALAYEYRHPRNVIVLDDSDRIFDDEEGLNILKCLLDTSVERKVNWMTDHPRFKGEGSLPKEFSYSGSMIFLTNKNFQEYLDKGKGVHIDHMAALMSRSLYLDLKMHSRREVALWTRHLVMRNRILQLLPGDPRIPSDVEESLMRWLLDHVNDLRELSIRTAIKLGKLYQMSPDKWQHSAKVLLLKEV